MPENNEDTGTGLIPEERWYHLADELSRVDELLEVQIQLLQQLVEKPTLKLPTTPIPGTMESYLQEISESLKILHKNVSVPIDVFSLALTIPADTAEGAATSVTEMTTIPYDSIDYVILHFPDASRLKAKIFLTCNGNQILPIKKRNDGVNYVAMRNATMVFPLNYKINGIMELKLFGWNSDTEDSHQVFALVGCRQKE